MIRGLQLLAIMLGLAVLAATAWLFVPLFTPTPAASERKSTLPDYDYTPWYALPVQHGRVMPFQSFANDAVRQITGRQKFEGHDAVAIVLAWWLTEGRGAGERFTNWEEYPFILCDHHGLRQTIFAHEPQATAEQAKGKYIAPRDLRVSPGFDRLLSEVSKARQELGAKAHQRLTAVQLKAEEVGRRLVLHDQLCGKAITRLHTNALCAEQFIDVPELSFLASKPPEQALLEFERKLSVHPDPLRLVALDPVPGSEWYSLSELRAVNSDSTKWLAYWAEHRRRVPTASARGMGTPAAPSGEMAGVLCGFHQAGEAYRTSSLMEEDTSFARFSEALIQDVRDVSDWLLIANASEDAPEIREFRLRFLSSPRPSIWDSGTGPWREQRDRFFQLAKLRDWGYEPHPGTNTIELELEYNRVQPFLWAWVLQLAATFALGCSLLGWRLAYLVGIGLFCVSMLLQLAGFAARIAISGWAPVTNMYESVIFVAFVAGLLALVLELIYRKKVIALAGALVSTLGLILADQLPLALDPKISPVVPVLRTNYWLTIHVITIICGYGAGTLAWGLGNVSLAMLAFGKGSAETLKMLGQFTYRAMQVTVMLLAAGTFLGAWWAAEAWGRFWGWDPKETGAFIALVCYVIPLHARYIGWVREFGLAVSAVLCYAAILLSWYIVNFVLAAGLHSYGFGAGGGAWVLWAGLLNLEWLVIASLLFARKQAADHTIATPTSTS
jgi:ABC-type transport system involved in cytochrome c biogenesis permease subunit